MSNEDGHKWEMNVHVHRRSSHEYEIAALTPSLSAKDRTPARARAWRAEYQECRRNEGSRLGSGRTTQGVRGGSVSAAGEDRDPSFQARPHPNDRQFAMSMKEAALECVQTERVE